MRQLRMAWRRDQAGQAIVLLALAMSGLLASVGMVIDLGFAARQVRVDQNAADAAALVGARAVARGDWSTIARDITDFAERSGLADPDGIAYDGVNANLTWTYVDNAGNPTIQAQATGVRVDTQQSFQTQFLRIIGINTIPTARHSTALVEQVTGLGATAPFAVYEQQNSGTLDVLSHDAAGNPNGLNPAAVGQTFLIHGPQVEHPFGSNSFKGLLPTDHGPLNVGDSIPYMPGVRAGPTRTEVQAIGTSFLVLPIFDARDAALGQVHIVGFAVFDVQQVGANKHTGTLVAGTFFATGTGSRTWVPGSTFNVATLKLVY